MITTLLLIAAAFMAGAINSVAGGGSFLTFPSLVFAGVPAVIANASNTVALVPGSLASAFSYRGDIARIEEGRIKIWLWVSLLGGAIGAALLLFTSDKAFRQLAPWLLFFATLLFAFGGRISVALRGRLHSSQSLMRGFLFPIAIYGGYFGGGIGIMILAAFRLYGLTDIHGMNGVKTNFEHCLECDCFPDFYRRSPDLVASHSAYDGGGYRGRLSRPGAGTPYEARNYPRSCDCRGSDHDGLLFPHCTTLSLFRPLLRLFRRSTKPSS